MAPTFPELHKNEEKIKDIITEEEVSFGRTLLKVILYVCDSHIYCFSLSFKFNSGLLHISRVSTSSKRLLQTLQMEN